MSRLVLVAAKRRNGHNLGPEAPGSQRAAGSAMLCMRALWALPLAVDAAGCDLSPWAQAVEAALASEDPKASANASALLPQREAAGTVLGKKSAR